MSESTAKMICCFLGEQRYAADIGHVKETIVLKPITRVFLTPPWVAGLINLRGDVVAVLDLSAFLGLGAAQLGADTRILIAHCRGKTAGLLVDRLDEVRLVDRATLESTPSTFRPEVATLSAGVVTLESGDPLVVLDLPKLFDSERMQAFARKA